MSVSNPHTVPPPRQYPWTCAIVTFGKSHSFSTGVP